MKKIISILAILILGVFLSACKNTPKGDPQSIINSAWEKLALRNSTYKSGEMKFSGKGNIEVDSSSAEASGSGTVIFDSTDEKNMKSAISVDLNGNGDLEGKKGKFALKGQLKLLEKSIFVFLENLNLETDNPQTNMMANLLGNLYKSQWITLPSNTVETPDTVSLDSFKTEKVAELAKKHHFFEIKEDLGNGRYEVIVNVEKLKEYLKEIGELNQVPLTAEDLAAIDNFFKTITYTLQVGIDGDYDLTWAKGTINANDETEGQTLNLSFEGNIDDNQSDGFIDLAMDGTTPGKARVEFEIEHEEKPVTIDKPADAKDFDLGALLGGGLGGAPEVPSIE